MVPLQALLTPPFPTLRAGESVAPRWAAPWNALLCVSSPLRCAASSHRRHLAQEARHINQFHGGMESLLHPRYHPSRWEELHFRFLNRSMLTRNLKPSIHGDDHEACRMCASTREHFSHIHECSEMKQVFSHFAALATAAGFRCSATQELIVLGMFAEGSRYHRGCRLSTSSCGNLRS